MIYALYGLQYLAAGLSIHRIEGKTPMVIIQQAGSSKGAKGFHLSITRLFEWLEERRLNLLYPYHFWSSIEL